LYRICYPCAKDLFNKNSDLHFIEVIIGAALFLLFTILSNDQDASGKGMAFLPILLLVGGGIESYILMQNSQMLLATEVDRPF
jgi:hypothetical protein